MTSDPLAARGRSGSFTPSRAVRIYYAGLVSGHEHREGCAFPFGAHQNRDPEAYESQQCVSREPLKTARRALAQQLPHHQRQVESAEVNQHALENIFSSAQVHAPHATRLISMREAAFH